MSLVSLNNAHFDYGREKILRGVNVALHPGVKVALVGANGAGKTTLLAALSGDIELPAGMRQISGSTRIRLLRQETSLDPGIGAGAHLLEAVAEAAFHRELKLERELERLAAEMERAPTETQAAMVREQGRLQMEYERLDGYSVQSRLETALRGVGLLPETWGRPVDRLSGGERRRAALAAVLLSGDDLLLLDEPTNHLDLESCEWLEGFLDQFPGAAIIVSHDRHFLDRVATRTLHLDRGKVINYSGNYSFFDEQSRLRFQQDLSAWQRQQTRIRQTEEYIRRNIEGQKTRQAQARRKQMAKEEKLERPTAEPGLFRFHLQPVRSSGGTVLQTEGLTKGFETKPLIRDLDLHISRSERVGIIGPNGCGKSTLLKLLAGRLIPDAGKVVPGHNVDLGFYDQELSGVSDHNTVINEIATVEPTATLGELRSFLAAFGFGEDLFDRPVGQLSGGERGRLSLLRLIKEGHNTLLLDEPTNHLDIRSRESLEAALAEYTGTLVVVSHDRRFLDKIVDRLVIFPAVEADPESAASTVQDYAGNYAEYVRDRNQHRAQVAAQATETGSRTTGSPDSATNEIATPIPGPSGRTLLSKNEQNRRRQWIAEVEEKIIELETEKDDALAEMGAPDLDNQRRVDLARRCAEIETELSDQMGRWEQWSLEIEEGV